MGSQQTAEHRASDYALSNAQAETLKGAVLLPAEFRIEILRRYAAEHGPEALVALFAQFIGLANSVVANNREMAEIVLITAGGMWPNTAEQVNLPTVFGALCGVKLANSVPQKRMCGGCAFRLGSCANQSPVTTADVDWCEPGGDRFMCHEDMNDDGSPKHVCRGFARLHASDSSTREGRTQGGGEP